MDDLTQPPPPPPAPPMVGLPKGLAIASMVLGIVSLVIFCAWPLSIPCAIVGLILGIMAGGKAKRGEAGGRGMATAGVITSAVAIALATLVIVLQIAAFMRHDSYEEAPPFQEEVSVQSESQQYEQGQPDAPSSVPSDATGD